MRQTENSTPSKIIVTGGAGFIGSHLVEALLKKNHSVEIYDNFSSGNLDNLKSVASDIKLIQGDIRNLDKLTKVMQGAGWVFHLAALTSVSESVDNPLLAHEINNTGTLNVLWAALKTGVSRVVISSSCAVYGDIHSPPLKETDSPAPKSPYAASKLTAEALAESFYHSYGLETVCLRYFNVYGKRQNPNSDYAAVIPRFIYAYKNKQNLNIYGDGYQSRDFIHVSDVVKANLLAASLASSILTQHRIFNVGTGQNVSLRQLLDVISEQAGYYLQPSFQSPRTGDIRVSQADITLANTKLGFTPSVDLKTGIEDLYLS